MFRRLKKVNSYYLYDDFPRFTEVFPELDKLSYNELSDRLKELGINFYTEEKAKVKPLLRLTMPFAVTLMAIMFIFLPINYILTGHWNYGNGDKSFILNWFRALNLVR